MVDVDKMQMHCMMQMQLFNSLWLRKYFRPFITCVLQSLAL